MSFTPIVDRCRAYVGDRSSRTARLIRAVWKVEYALGWKYASTLAAPDRPVLREFVLVECESIGACHQEVMGPSLLLYDCIGRDALDLDQFPISYRIAALDACAAAMLPQADDQIQVFGSGAERLAIRSDLILQEVAGVMRGLDVRRAMRVTVIGALDSIIKGLLRLNDVHVTAADADPTVIGRQYHGVIVQPSTETLSLIRTSDIAVITGMVLATETFDAVMAAAQTAGCYTVMFSQTGGNLVQPLMAAGVNVIVSEAYPFCFMGVGESRLRIYRRL